MGPHVQEFLLIWLSLLRQSSLECSDAHMYSPSSFQFGEFLKDNIPDIM